MSATSVYSTHTNSRLIALLCELLGADGEIPHPHFIAKLSKLIDFSGAIELSTSLAAPVKQKESNQAEHSPAVSEVFMNTRKSMLEFIVQSFAAHGRYDQQFYLPLPSDQHFSHQDNGLSSYQHFYSLHQSEMEIRVAKLVKRIRQYLSAHSLELARLAALDTTFHTVMGSYSRKAFASIPELLAKRFQSLFASQPDAEEALIRNQFVEEMRSLLLAELDIRLKPALGLVESVVSADHAVQEENKSL